MPRSSNGVQGRVPCPLGLADASGQTSLRVLRPGNLEGKGCDSRPLHPLNLCPEEFTSYLAVTGGGQALVTHAASYVDNSNQLYLLYSRGVACFQYVWC